MSHAVKSHPDFSTRFSRPDAGLAGKSFPGFGVERAGDGRAISHQDAMSQGGRNVGPFVRDESGVAHADEVQRIQALRVCGCGGSNGSRRGGRSSGGGFERRCRRRQLRQTDRRGHEQGGRWEREQRGRAAGRQTARRAEKNRGREAGKGRGIDRVVERVRDR